MSLFIQGQNLFEMGPCIRKNGVYKSAMVWQHDEIVWLFIIIVDMLVLTYCVLAYTSYTKTSMKTHRISAILRLTHLTLDKMSAISHTTCSNAFLEWK